MTVQRLQPHEVISTMNSESFWLAIAEITISREHSQHLILKGTKLEYRAYAMQMHVSVFGETTDSYSQAKQ